MARNLEATPKRQRDNEMMDLDKGSADAPLTRITACPNKRIKRECSSKSLKATEISNSRVDYVLVPSAEVMAEYRQQLQQIRDELGYKWAEPDDISKYLHYPLPAFQQELERLQRVQQPKRQKLQFLKVAKKRPEQQQQLPQQIMQQLQQQQIVQPLQQPRQQPRRRQQDREEPRQQSHQQIQRQKLFDKQRPDVLSQISL